MMNQKITDIQKLLRRNLFLSEEKKTAILEKLHQSPEEASIQRLKEILEQADGTQTRLLQKIIQKNPHFLEEVNHLISNEKKSEIREAEADLRTQESQEIEKLEAEIDSLLQ